MASKTASARTTSRSQPSWPERPNAHEEEQPRLSPLRSRAEKRHFIAELSPQARRYRFMAW